MTKKAQAQIITTVLIILLVLAAIVIVWQVVSSTINKGAEEIEEQSSCIGLRVEITNIDTTANIITIRPTKDITGYRAYVGGDDFGEVGGDLDALDTETIAGASISTGDEIEVIGRIGETWCPGTKKTA